MLHEDVVKAMYQGILERPIDPESLVRCVDSLKNGGSLVQIIWDISHSEEFKLKNPQDSNLVVKLPDLTKIYPDRYSSKGDGTTIYHAKDDDGVAFMEKLINDYRYYDSFGIWSPIVDTDKKITAGIVESLGGKKVIELGCFAGAALSVMKNNGLDVLGVELSHRAFLLADSNIVQNIKYGDLLDVNLYGTFDAFLGMDILEHLSPLKLDLYIEKIRELIGENGFAYINSPMFGVDRIFGTVFSQYLPTWQEVGDAKYWYDMHCDETGWPMHGHLVWASPVWWEQLFARHGLFRDDTAEAMLQDAMDPFFQSNAPARKSFFVLRLEGAKPDHAELKDRIAQHILPLIG